MKASIDVQIPAQLADEVETIAARLGRSRDWVVEQALTAWTAAEETRRRMTLDALEEVDSGSVVDHAGVRAWAASLSRRRRARR